MSKVYLEHRDAYHVPGASTEEEVAHALQRVAEAMESCDALVITAGAGMGVDSGMPAFRGNRSLWKDREVSMTYEEMSDDKWFFEDPAFAWGINYTQLEMYRHTLTHAGYHTLWRWTQTLCKPWFVFTSNIDGHFEKAGFHREKVVTCHGDIHHLQCVNQQCRGQEKSDNVWSAGVIPSGLGDKVDQSSLRFTDTAVLDQTCFRCPRCNSLARPNIWFCSDRNHAFWPDESDRRQAFIKWMEALHEAKKRVVVIECGGGMDIPTVRCEGEDAVEEAGVGSLLVRINPTDCRVPAEKGVGLPFGAKEGCERIDAALAARRSSASSGPAGGGRGGGARRSSSGTGRESATVHRRASPGSGRGPRQPSLGRGPRQPSPPKSSK